MQSLFALHRHTQLTYFFNFTAMDPVSLTLGALPIAAKLLASSLTGYHLLRDISAIGEDAQVMICRLQIEHTRLRLWASDLRSDGADFDDQLEKRGIRTLVVLILAHLCTMFTDTERLRKVYGLLAPQGEVAVTIPPVLPTFLTLFGVRSSTVASTTEAVKKYTDHTQRSLTIVEKWKFVLRDKKKFADLLDQLQYFNDSLFNLMTPVHRARLGLTLSSRMIDSTTDPAELERIKSASQTTDAPLSSSAKMKRFHLLLHSPETSFVSAAQLRCARERLALDSTLVQPGRSQRVLGWYGDTGSQRRVIAECKQYNRNLPREETIDRIQDIARLLFASSSCRSADLPLPDCLGYVEDNTKSQCWFLYPAPADTKSVTTLEDLLPESFDPTRMPNLEDRLELARALAAAVFRLHLTGWLHKGLRSSNVTYLTSPKDDLHGVVRPTLMGFGYSRPDRPNEKSDHLRTPGANFDLYIHPEYQLTYAGTTIPATNDDKTKVETRFERAYDIYALGIILIEIALWQPVRCFHKKKYDAKKWHDVLRDIAHVHLAHLVGSKYRDVVKRSLDWNPAVSSLPQSAEGNEDPFLTLVVIPLFECP